MKSRKDFYRAWAEGTAEAPFDDEAGRARLLSALEASRRPAPPRLARPRALALLAAAAAVLVMGAALFALVPRSHPAPRFTAGDRAGQVGAWLATDEGRELPVTFSEGTRLVIAPDSRGRVEDVEASGARFLLERGAVHAKVVHQQATSWRFVAGPFEVHVTGTELGVEWDPGRERFSVRVDEGAVTLRGPYVGRDQVVRAGERCVVDIATQTMKLSPSSAVDAGPLAEPSGAVSARESPPAPASAPNAHHPKPSWTALEQQGNYDAAHAAIASAGVNRVIQSSSSEELLRIAQVGRLSGHRDTEREALLACRRRFPGKAQASVAAYELGRASSPAEAAGWFEAYLREQPSGPLEREALGRLLEARTSMGDTAAAKTAATRYLERHPDGPQAPLARRILGGTTE